MAGESAFDYEDLLGGAGSWRSRLILLGGLGLVTALVIGAVWWEFMRGGGAATAAAQTATVSLGDVTKSVSTSGTVAAQSTTNLNFTTTGTGSSRITKVDVTLGQSVKQGDVLMELDPTNAQTALDSAKLSLAIQQSKLGQLLQGATPAQQASADQSVQQAQANYDKAVRAMQTLQQAPDAAALETAQQAVVTAQAQLQQARDARAKLDTDRSSTLTTAQASAQNAQNALTSAQQAQASAAANVTTDQQILFAAESTYCAAPPATTASFCGASTAPVPSGDQVTLSGIGAASPDHANAAAVLAANSSYTKAVSDKTAADNAVTSAQNAVTAASNAVATAQAGPTTGQIAVADAAIGSAQAQVDSAQSKLLALQAGPTPNALSDAQAAIDGAAASLTSAQAQSAQTYAGALPSDIQQQRASVSQTQTSVATAQQNLDSTKLIAPFDGTVAALNNQVGDLAGSGTSATTAAIVLNTPNQVVLNMSIGETDYASVKAGQTGTATFSGIPGRTFPIMIDAIGTNPTTQQGVVSYQARAHFVARPAGGFGGAGATNPATGVSTPGGPARGQGGASGTPGAGGGGGGRRATAAAATAAAGGTPTTPQPGVTPADATTPVSPPAAGGGRQGFGGGAGTGSAATLQMPVPGMNATITIITDQRQNVLRVPNAAVQRNGQDRVLQVKQSDGSTKSTVVQVGLSDTTNTEITSGVAEGDTVVLPGVVATSGAATGAPTTAAGRGGLGGGFGGGGGGGGGRAAGD